MYKIIGTDGKEYGPVSAEQLRQWLGEGRVNFQTRVQAGGSADWQALGALPEFAADRAAAAAVPPALAAGMAPAKTSGLAITSLVLGILGFFCGLPALPGLILGFVSLHKIKRSNGSLGGQGIALAGTIVSGVCLLLSLVMIPIMVGMLLPALAKAKGNAQTINCVNNVRQLCLATIMYADDHNDTLPPGATWCDAIQTQVGSVKVFQCPAGAEGNRSHYAFNARLAGLDLKKITNAGTTVLFFETDGGWNLSGGPELMLKPSRHGGVSVVGFADGHVEQVSDSRLNNLRWDP
jgi:prepilin-type processing-associated H-X9-DG protein